MPTPVVPGVGIVGSQEDGYVEVADRPGQVAQLGVARPPAVVGHRVAGGQPDGGVVVLQRRAALSQVGIGVSSAQVGIRIAGVEVDDPGFKRRISMQLPVVPMKTGTGWTATGTESLGRACPERPDIS